MRCWAARRACAGRTYNTAEVGLRLQIGVRRPLYGSIQPNPILPGQLEKMIDIDLRVAINNVCSGAIIGDARPVAVCVESSTLWKERHHAVGTRLWDFWDDRRLLGLR